MQPENDLPRRTQRDILMGHDFILRRKQQGIDLEEINGSDVKKYNKYPCPPSVNQDKE